MNNQMIVLFLCTGNSCRSQMAEALVNHRMADQWLAVSAGTKPAGYIHPLALQVLTECDIFHQGESKLADQYRDWDFDLVITVCDSAAEECPIWLGQGVRIHHSFPDPAEAVGTDEQILAEFRSVRDAIGREIPKLLEKYAPQ